VTPRDHNALTSTIGYRPLSQKCRMTDAVGQSTPSRRRRTSILKRSFFERSAAPVTSFTYPASFFRQRDLDRAVFHSAIVRNWSRVRYMSDLT